MVLKNNGKITAFTVFDENHGFHDFRVSMIIYCPYISIKASVCAVSCFYASYGFHASVYDLCIKLH